MKSLLLAGAASIAIAGIALAGGAWAAPITGEISINGDDTFTPTSISFVGMGNVGGTTGSFTVLPNCNDCVTMLGTTFTASSTGTLFDVVDAGHTSTLNLSPPQVFDFTPNANPALDALEVTGNGTLSLDGSSVAGSYVLTTQGPTSSSVTFSATAVPTTPISEPGGLPFLIIGIASAFGYRWFHRMRPFNGGVMG